MRVSRVNPMHDHLRKIINPLPRALFKRIHPSDSLVLAAKKNLIVQFRQLLRHEKGTYTGQEMEDLHQMRVATRRMRVCLRYFSSVFSRNEAERMQEDLKWLAGLLGGVRDKDTFLIFLETIEPEILKRDAEHFHQVREELLEQRRKKLEALRRAMEEKRYRLMKKILFRALSTPQRKPSSKLIVEETLPRILYRIFRKTFRPLQENEETPQALHKCRIRCKRLRYVCEFFQSCYTRKIMTLIHDLKSVQDILGCWHDAVRDIDFLQTTVGTPAVCEHGEAEPHPAGAVMQRLQEQKEDSIKAFDKKWKEMNGTAYRKLARKVIRKGIRGA